MSYGTRTSTQSSRRRRGGWLTSALAAAVWLGVALPGRPASATDWVGFGLDPARSRASGEMVGARFALSWRADMTADRADAVYRTLLASPAVADGFIAVASYGNVVRVLREADGATVWQTQLGDALIASPTIDRGWLYVPCLDRNLYAFRLSDGHLIWKVDLGGIAYSSPVVTGGAVVVAAGSPTPRVLRLDAETGAIVWSAGADILQQSLDSSVVVASGHVIVGETDGRFHSFAFTDGRHEWQQDTGGTTGLASPVVAGDRAYLPVGGATARIVAVELATGAPVPDWSVDLTASLVGGNGTGTRLARRIRLSSLAVVDGLILANARGEDTVDTDGNGVADLFRLRENVVALDVSSGQVAWVAANGVRDAADPNQIPTHGLIPTPAVHRALTGEGLVVVTSTLIARVTVLDLATGASRSSLLLPSATRASPASANGRVMVVTDAGVIVALASAENAAPVTPAGLSPNAGAASDASGTVVSWRAVMDFDGDAVSYQVRWDTDGEILHDAAGEAVVTNGATAWRLPSLPVDTTVTYAVRARDARGAWSAWSGPATFAAVSTPPVQIGSNVVASLSAAIAAAQSGQVIQLGMGRYPLAETMRVPGGVTLRGAAPHLTVLDGRGLSTAVTFGSSDADHPSTLRDLTVKGAGTGVATGPGSHVLLQNVVVSDSSAFGIDVGASGAATVISATLVRNDVAARSFGAMTIRNSLIAMNRRGLVATPADALVSRYDDLFNNTEVAYENVVAGKGDLTRPVAFRAADAGDWRVSDESPTTDRGDPADDFSREPAPNGGRINLGAFAGTELAELSAPLSLGSSVGTTLPARATPVGPTAAAAETPTAPKASGGCALAPGSGTTGTRLGRDGDPLGIGVALVMLAMLARRRGRRACGARGKGRTPPRGPLPTDP